MDMYYFGLHAKAAVLLGRAALDDSDYLPIVDPCGTAPGKT